MSRHIALCLLAALCLLTAGCILSLHPLYTKDDVVFEPKLVGAWVKDDESWEFERDGEKNRYNVLYVVEGEPGRFEGHLVRLGQFTFLDLMPKDPDAEKNKFYNHCLLPTHTFIKLSLEGDDLRLAAPDMDRVKKLLDDEVRIAHEEVEQRLVLTAPTREVQEFILFCAGDGKAFGEPATFRRKRPAGAKKG